MGWNLNVTGFHPGVDGEYPVDLTQLIGSLKNKDLRRIKELADVRAGELREAFRKGDHETLLALALIHLERLGKTIDEDELWDADVGQIAFVEQVEGDARPPDLSSPQPEPATESAASGSSSRTSGEPTQVMLTPNGSGTEPLEPSAISEIPSPSAS